jgi:hypothetical protein
VLRRGAAARRRPAGRDETGPGAADVTGLDITSIVVAVIGAIVVVAIYRLFMGRRTA